MSTSFGLHTVEDARSPLSGTHKKAFVKKMDLPLATFLAKVASTPPNPGFCLFGPVSLAAFAAYSQDRCRLLHQAPIGIKMPIILLWHPLPRERTRISSAPCRVQGYVQYSWVFSTTFGLAAWTASDRHKPLAGDRTVPPLNQSGIAPTTRLVRRPPRIPTRTVFPPRRGPGPS